ncbi:MAG TPA: tetratricopeptide repeat protein [Kofleriaceae bacterium]
MVSQGRTEDAVREYTEIIRIRPDYALAYADRGTVRAMRNELDLAGADFERSFSLGHHEPAALSAAASVYMQLREYPRSLALFARALELDPTYAFAYYNRSRVFHEMGQYESAVMDLERCLALQPDEAFRRAVQERLDMVRPLVSRA